jgi:anti-anti-sigma factor
MEPMKTELSPENRVLGAGTLTISLEGPVDMETVPGLRKRLLEAAGKRALREVHLDFSRVTFLDTSGVAMLVEIWRASANRDGQVRLSGLSDNARKLIELARLDQIFVITDDMQGKA